MCCSFERFSRAIVFLLLLLLCQHSLVTIVSSLSPSHDVNVHRNIAIDPAVIQESPSNEDTIRQQRDHLLPATSRVRLEVFGNIDTTRKQNVRLSKKETTIATDSRNSNNHEHNPPLRRVLRLKRRDGIDLYGRLIVHDKEDACAATMTFLDETNKCGAGQNKDSNDESMVWEATLVLQPDNNPQPNSDRMFFAKEHEQSSRNKIQTSTTTSCFVAMNRFDVQENCKALFEERWAQRQSKLSSQPGFLGFSLLRRKQQEQSSSPHNPCYTHRFNYSTCTIWDSTRAWEQWRNGGGKTSHDASREKQQGTKPRVPVSEWLRGPSSPIFWDGVLFYSSDDDDDASSSLAATISRTTTDPQQRSLSP